MYYTYRATSEALPCEVKVVDVRRNRNHEVECILVDDTFPNVEEFRLQTCNTSNTQVIGVDHVKTIPNPNSGTQPGLITPYILFWITTGLSEKCSGTWRCFAKWEIPRVSKKYGAFIFRVGISKTLRLYYPSKRRYLVAKRHGVTYQKTNFHQERCDVIRLRGKITVYMGSGSTVIWKAAYGSHITKRSCSMRYNLNVCLFSSCFFE